MGKLNSWTLSVFVNIHVGDSGVQGSAHATRSHLLLSEVCHACGQPLSRYEGQCPPWHGGKVADSAPPLEMEAVQ